MADLGKGHIRISIHALLAESDTARPVLMMTGPNISIHALLAESDPEIVSRSSISCQFLSTLSLRRATVMTHGATISLLFLSTLSLRRATMQIGIMLGCILNFYPRSPCGERHARSLVIDWAKIIFLSTLSLRRATAKPMDVLFLRPHFYPRSPCGERLWLDRWSTKEDQFLSTLSLRRATK